MSRSGWAWILLGFIWHLGSRVTHATHKGFWHDGSAVIQARKKIVKASINNGTKCTRSFFSLLFNTFYNSLRSLNNVGGCFVSHAARTGLLFMFSMFCFFFGSLIYSIQFTLFPDRTPPWIKQEMEWISDLSEWFERGRDGSTVFVERRLSWRTSGETG